MELKKTLTNANGQEIRAVYREGDPLVDLGSAILHGVHAYCFCGDKLVIVYSEKKGYWTPLALLSRTENLLLTLTVTSPR